MTSRTIHDDEVEALQNAQSTLILAAFDGFLRSAPGREVRLTRDEQGVFRVVLVDERESRGESLRDALAQVATVLVLNAEVPT